MTVRNRLIRCVVGAACLMGFGAAAAPPGQASGVVAQDIAARAPRRHLRPVPAPAEYAFVAANSADESSTITVTNPTGVDAAVSFTVAGRQERCQGRRDWRDRGRLMKGARADEIGEIVVG